MQPVHINPISPVSILKFFFLIYDQVLQSFNMFNFNDNSGFSVSMAAISSVSIRKTFHFHSIEMYLAFIGSESRIVYMWLKLVEDSFPCHFKISPMHFCDFWGAILERRDSISFQI